MINQVKIKSLNRYGLDKFVLFLAMTFEIENEAVKLPFFYPDINARDAEQLLTNHAHGTYLLRYSSIREFTWLYTPLALSFVHNTRVCHIRIEIIGRICCFENDFEYYIFENIPRLLEHFSHVENAHNDDYIPCLYPLYKQFTLQELCIKCIRINNICTQYFPTMLKQLYNL